MSNPRDIHEQPSAFDDERVFTYNPDPDAGEYLEEHAGEDARLALALANSPAMLAASFGIEIDEEKTAFNRARREYFTALKEQSEKVEQMHDLYVSARDAYLSVLYERSKELAPEDAENLLEQARYEFHLGEQDTIRSFLERPTERLRYDDASAEEIAIQTRNFNGRQAQAKARFLESLASDNPAQVHAEQQAYTEAVADYLIATERAAREQFRTMSDGGMRYERFMDQLYTEFIVTAREDFRDEHFDTIEILLTNPELVTLFGSRAVEEYGGPARTVLKRLRKPTFQGFEGVFNTDGGMDHGKRKISELHEARLEVFTAVFAETLGYKDTNRREKEKRYLARRTEILGKLKRPYAEGDWLTDYHRRFTETDQKLQNAIAAYALPEERRKELPRLNHLLHRVMSSRGVRLAAIFGLLATALATDVAKEVSNQMPQQPRFEELDTEREQQTQQEEQEIEAAPAQELHGEISGARGAIGALDQLTERAEELPWLNTWMQETYANTRPSLVRTHDGQMEVLAQELGFLSYMPTFDEVHPYVEYSARLPEGARLRADTSGLYLRYNDGREVQLVIVHPKVDAVPPPGREVPPITVIGFGNEPGDSFNERYTR